MEALGDYGSGSEEEEDEEQQEPQLGSFKAAWEMDEEDSDDEEANKKDKDEPAKQEIKEPESKKKKRLLPNALDALKSATATFLSAPEPEPEGEGPAAPSKRPPQQVPAVSLQKASDSGDGVAARLAKVQAEIAAEKAKEDKKKQNWNAKEKRKRDLGQASKDKNWVEEEKRILRQGGGE